MEIKQSVKRAPGRAELSENVIAVVGSAAWRMAMPFMAERDFLYYLNGICLRPLGTGGAVISATNGHMAILIRDENALVSEEVIVNIPPGAAPFLRSARRSVDLVVCRDGSARLEGTGGVINTQFVYPKKAIIEGTFPDLAGILSGEFVEGLLGSFNPHYLDKALDAARAVEGRNNGIRFYHRKGGDDNSVALFRIATFELEVVGAIMPMRGDRLGGKAPSWIARSESKKPPETPKKAKPTAVPVAPEQPAPAVAEPPAVEAQAVESAPEPALANQPAAEASES